MPDASPDTTGLVKFPALSTGIRDIKKGFAYLDTVATGVFGCLIIPSVMSCHITLLSLVYGAGPYVSIHQEGSSVNPNISQGHT